MKRKHYIYLILTVVMSYGAGFFLTKHRQEFLSRVGFSQKPILILTQQKIIPPIVEFFLESQLQRKIEVREITYAGELQNLQDVDWILVPQDWLKNIENTLVTIPYDEKKVFPDFQTEKILKEHRYLPLFWSYPLTLVEENESLTPPHVLAFQAGKVLEKSTQSAVQIISMVSLRATHGRDSFVDWLLDANLQKKWLSLIPYASCLSSIEESALPFYQKPSHLRTLPLKTN